MLPFEAGYPLATPVYVSPGCWLPLSTPAYVSPECWLPLATPAYVSPGCWLLLFSVYVSPGCWLPQLMSPQDAGYLLATPVFCCLARGVFAPQEQHLLCGAGE